MSQGEAQPPVPPRTAGPAVPGALNSTQRAADLRRMEGETLDVLVVGGGVVGGGCALDAVARGLSVGLVEKADFASGTSSRSSRLAHGGLRYLEQARFGLVSEALVERHRLVTEICPHLARPLPFLLPLRRALIDRAYLGAGVALYDLLSKRGGRGLGRAEHLSRASALKRFPGLEASGLRGGILYNDAQIDDARHTLALVRTASARGAAVASGLSLEGLSREGGVQRATVLDRETGEQVELRARWVVVAAGAWSEGIGQRIGSAPISLKASKGVHLVVPREAIAGDVALIDRTKTSVLLILPWGDHWLIGTTDTAWDLPPDVPLASEADVSYLLQEANRVLSSSITREDVVGVYAGLRPLVTAQASTAKISREHVVSTAPGVVFIAGGKYTTYRVMAAEAVDPVAQALGAGASVTDRLPLIGSDDLDATEAALRRDHGGEEAERLIRRYGGEAQTLAPSLGEQIAGGGGLRRGEIAWACEVEGASHLGDVLRHRTRLAIEAGDAGGTAAPAISKIMARCLGWDETHRESELRGYLGSVDGERVASLAADDLAAAEVYDKST